jgi:hypothetical protein
MDLTTNGIVITDAIKFVQNSKEKLNQSTTSQNEDDNKESKEPDYEDDKDTDLEEEKQQQGIDQLSTSN